MKSILYRSILALGLVLYFSACTDPDELVTTEAKTGGLLVPVSPNLSYVLSVTTDVDIVIEVPKGPGVQSVKLYKSYCLNCNDDELAEISDEILVATLDVGGANANEATEVSLTQNYQTLKQGISINGQPLPDNELDLVIGDYWQYRLVTVMQDGRELMNNSAVTVSVANKYSGEYMSVGKFVHPTAGPRDINKTKTLKPIDFNTCETEYADLGGSGWTMRLRVNDDNSVTLIPTGAANTATVQDGPNFYDPATKSFTLTYRYAGGGGDRKVNEVITMVE